jgi:hypothetical protein
VSFVIASFAFAAQPHFYFCGAAANFFAAQRQIFFSQTPNPA